jgi:hypothetical protein
VFNSAPGEPTFGEDMPDEIGLRWIRSFQPCWLLRKGKTSSSLDAHRNHLPQSTDVVGIDPFVGDVLE